MVMIYHHFGIKSYKTIRAIHEQIIIEKNDQLLKINHIVFLHLNLIISKKYSNKILLIILLFFLEI